MNILITGGAGYIGSFMASALLDEGHGVTVLDDLSRGNREFIDSRASFEKGDLGDGQFLNNLFSKEKFDAIIHFAGLISMGESMEKPYDYFYTNTCKTLQFFEIARKNNIENYIFSSTAGVYGNPKQIPISEDHPKNPENPYGESKLMVEKILEWYSKIHNISFASLRYFNACGAELDGSRGENHIPETHLIPNAINAMLNNQEFHLYGTDYNTEDGTCVRDYIHVLDLAKAHLLALNKIVNTKGAHFYNVGTGVGYSNKQVISEIEKISGKKINVIEDKRRAGDADILVADVKKIKEELSFTPVYSDLETIITSSLKWHEKTHVGS